MGLILSHKGTNYGMMLQAFATQAFLEHKGVSTEIITVQEEPTAKSICNKIIRHLSPTALSASLSKRKRRKIVAADPVIYDAYKKRVEAGKEFVTTYLHNVVTYKGFDSATQSAKNKYDCVLIGSDQQWAPACFYSPLNTLMFVPDGVVKASYATSMGVSEIPENTMSRLNEFISRMDFVSVREETGKKIISDATGRKDVEVVADPTFLMTCDEWKDAIPDKVLETEPYVFCYFLGNSVEPIKTVNSFAEKNGLKVIAVRNIESYSTEKVDYGKASVLDGPTVDEFVNYIRHATLVCTDSFHATVFSIINSADFVSFYRTKPGEKNSRNSRIDDLLGRLHLSDRICYGDNLLENIAKNSIDYEPVQRIVEQTRKHGQGYLNRVIEASGRKNETSEKNVTVFPPEECCGCELCSLKCPQKIISMSTDQEGFLYPTIQDQNKCVSCGICVSICPVHNREKAITIDFSNPYYAYNPDVAQCQNSSSGGVAFGLYKAFIQSGEHGYGAAYAPDFKSVAYECADTIDQAKRFLGSKYVKTEHGSLYQRIKSDLANGIKVIIIGLPCDIAALKGYLNKDWANLYTCEVICHGPTTPIALKSFIEEIETIKKSEVVSLNCRAKRPYWKPYYISAHFENGDVLETPFTNSSLEQAFQAMKRPSCNACAFKDGSSRSDLIIGDYHGAKQGTEEFNEYGVSICFPVTNKGKELIEILKTEGFVVGNANKSRAMANKALTTSLEKLSIRDRFSELLISKGLTAATSDPVIKLGLKKRKIKMRIGIYKKALLKKLR